MLNLFRVCSRSGLVTERRNRPRNSGGVQLGPGSINSRRCVMSAGALRASTSEGPKHRTDSPIPPIDQSPPPPRCAPTSDPTYSTADLSARIRSGKSGPASRGRWSRFGSRLGLDQSRLHAVHVQVGGRSCKPRHLRVRLGGGWNYRWSRSQNMSPTPTKDKLLVPGQKRIPHCAWVDHPS